MAVILEEMQLIEMKQTCTVRDLIGLLKVLLFSWPGGLLVWSIILCTNTCGFDPRSSPDAHGRQRIDVSLSLFFFTPALPPSHPSLAF